MPCESGEGAKTAAACGAGGEAEPSCDCGEGANESVRATEGEPDSSCNPGEGKDGEATAECGVEDETDSSYDPGEGEGTAATAACGMEGESELSCDPGVDEAVAVVVPCGVESELGLPLDPSADVQVMAPDARYAAVEPVENPTGGSSKEAGVEAPPEVEAGVEVAEACEPVIGPAACPDTSPVLNPEPDVATLPEAEEAPEPPSEPQPYDASDVPFSLGDARSEKDDGCLAFSSINKGGRCAALLDKLHPEGPVKGNAAATSVLNWLDSRGYIETRSFEQVEGRYPTAQGYTVGIRWRLYPNERTGGLGTGIVFNEAAQKWLVEEVPSLVDSSAESARR